MTNTTQWMSSQDGWGYKSNSSIARTAGLLLGKALLFVGQTVNKVTGNVANQGVGTYALPIQASAGTYTTTISNSLITANSLIFLQVVNKPAGGGAGDATAGRGVTAWVEGDPTSGSVTVAYNTLVAMSQAWSVHILIVN